MKQSELIPEKHETSLSATRMIVDSLTSGILAVDLDMRVLFVNAALAQRLGIQKEACEGKPAQKLFDSVISEVPLRQAPLYRLQDTRASLRAQSREVQCRDGSRLIHLREDSAPLKDESGQLVGRLFAYHDLSWEKTVDQMKSDFISIASHELRTPMTSIKGGIDLILGGCVGEVGGDAVELLQVAQTACDRMIRLINDLLDLSKIEAGQIQLKLEPLNLVEVAERSLRSLKPLATQDQIILKLNVPQDLPSVQADSDPIEQVVTNLVANAMKFSPACGEVCLELSANESWVSCSVSDQGCGIQEADLDRIFGKFQQASSPQRGGGTGLGLAITHALVTEHGGKIWAESQVGHGSRFVFCLPRAARPSQSRGTQR
ncbi:MAG: cell wall metabolism sensor histidine kinase WalK [Acidobacteriia bacterium]|nr:cell wall metabolism sensor histidine kinase WalK [Terriglobia bacterium]